MTHPRENTGPICIAELDEPQNFPEVAGSLRGAYFSPQNLVLYGPRHNWCGPGSDVYTLLAEDDVFPRRAFPSTHRLAGCDYDVAFAATIDSQRGAVARVVHSQVEALLHELIMRIVADSVIDDWKLIATTTPLSPHPRGQLVVAAQPAIVDRVLTALDSSKADWRTPRSLAKELQVSEPEIRKALESMTDEVRQPIAARGDELSYYRLTKRKKTWQERVRWLLLAVGGTPPNKIR